MKVITACKILTLISNILVWNLHENLKRIKKNPKKLKKTKIGLKKTGDKM